MKKRRKTEGGRGGGWPWRRRTRGLGRRGCRIESVGLGCLDFG